MTKTKTTPQPAVEEWKDKFKASSIRVGFQISLTRPMLEFICAVADDVHWDRATNGGGMAFPDNFIATGQALVKRGLVERRPQDEIDSRKNRPMISLMDIDCGIWVLTPPGKCLVEMLKMTGLFIEQDAAIHQKGKKAKAS